LTQKDSSGGPNAWSVRKQAPKVAVIGAGIVGASVAYHLARRGAAVTLIDKGQPAGECTGKSFAWIGPENPSSPLKSQTLEDYHRLERELNPALRINWSGALVWQASPPETERFVVERAAAGYDVRLLERDEISRLEPNLREPPAVAALEAGSGGVEPTEVTQLLVRAAQESGANARFDSEPAKLVVADSRVTGVRLGDEELEADIVVVAAGVGTNLLTEPVGLSLPIASSPAMLVRLRTPNALVNTVVAPLPRNVRQVSEDTLVTVEEGVEHATQAAAEGSLEDVRRMLAGTETLKLDGMGIGWRPMPADGLPIVGFAPDIDRLYSTVMHAGVNLGPAIGRLATVEILDEISVSLLDACRPKRFFDQVVPK
jgi:glycine/D-amino acid oxidase-like deaminating enzyme